MTRKEYVDTRTIAMYMGWTNIPENPESDQVDAWIHPDGGRYEPHMGVMQNHVNIHSHDSLQRVISKLAKDRKLAVYISWLEIESERCGQSTYLATAEIKTQAIIHTINCDTANLDMRCIYDLYTTPKPYELVTTTNKE